ncbi:hypothetical protein WS50_27955 [Burkholderia territorii]|nr:hypothetical protein WS47_05310 [Burkholderia territorii]KUZ06824.1 hypothetical protein WS50_27955 [Burkholderia territorii]
MLLESPISGAAWTDGYAVVGMVVATAACTGSTVPTAFLAATFLALAFFATCFFAVAFLTTGGLFFAATFWAATFLPETFSAAALLFTAFAFGSAAITSAFAIRKLERSLAPASQAGARPRPLHVAPVFGSRYRGGSEPCKGLPSIADFLAAEVTLGDTPSIKNLLRSLAFAIHPGARP